MKRIILFLILYGAGVAVYAQNRWCVSGHDAITWNTGTDIPHYDHIEMSGMKMSAVLRYGVDADGKFDLERSMVWPMLRTLPNNTHASLMKRFAIDYLPLLSVNGQTLGNERVRNITLDGTLTVSSEFSIGRSKGSTATAPPKATVEVTRIYFPSTDKAMLCELYTVRNIGSQVVKIIVPEAKEVYRTDSSEGVDGSYTMVSSIVSSTAGTHTLAAGEQAVFAATVQAFRNGEDFITADVGKELAARRDFVREISDKLVFSSPDTVLNTMFAFAKVRASESIYNTAGGLMHGPGGESYYAAIWTNDQAEYVNPFFPFLGYGPGNESAINSFRHFARFMNDDYKPIPSSIIAEGKDIWNGAGDRGDAAMIAYGAGRFALASGNAAYAEELWPLIEWCLEYCRRQLTADGVVVSDADELEGRFPAGNANLCTSSLYYDALISAARLASELKKPGAVAGNYMNRAQELRKSIASYFGADVEGFETYRYYEGNDVLRSWIAIPLTVGITERSRGTIDALFSPRLWTDDGLLTQAGTSTYWDRSTLYALRGVYAAGESKKATAYLKEYSRRRLLGDHVPYAIEAWPEGNQRHLSAESGLYCRIVTEGMFGIRPTGLRSFTLTPRLPGEWTFMELKNIYAFGPNHFDIRVTRDGDRLKVTIEQEGQKPKIYISKAGDTIAVRL